MGRVSPGGLKGTGTGKRHASNKSATKVNHKPQGRTALMEKKLTTVVSPFAVT